MKTNANTEETYEQPEKQPILASVQLRFTTTWKNMILLKEKNVILKEGGTNTIGQVIDNMLDDAMLDETARMYDIKIDFPDKG